MILTSRNLRIVCQEILDLILSTENLNTAVSRYEFPLVKEDKHHPSLKLYISYGCIASSSFNRNIAVRKYNFHRANLTELYMALSTVDWSDIDNSENVESACDYFYKSIYELLDQHVPKNNYRGRYSKFPVWFSRTTIDLIREKNRFWTKYRKNRLTYHHDKVKKLRRDIRREIRKDYNKFIASTENNIKSDPKKFWSYVNQKRKVSCIPGRMIYDNTVLSSSQDIVNAFASQFDSVFSASVNHICDSQCDSVLGNCDFCDKGCCPSLHVNPVCDNLSVLHGFSIQECDILKAVKKIKCNTVSGPDSIPAFLVVDCITCFVEPLCYIFNLILRKSVYPNVWKTSRILPIFKSGDKSNVKSYRPIALLSNFLKLFECILSEAIVSHVESKLSPDQHGFIKGRSTMTNLCEFTQMVSKALDHRLQVDVVYTDMTKAFDRVNHCILLCKLRKFGICEELISLIRSMIVSRRQYVEYSGFSSPSFSVNSGVAQGSNLGPLLFMIFFNDVSKFIGCQKFIFADDLKLTSIINSSVDCADLQKNIDKLTEWCDINQIELNVDKCKIMSFTRKNVPINFQYTVNGTPLQRCYKYKDLGVVMDPTLSFPLHIEHITTQAMKVLGFIIRNTSDFTNIYCIKMLFYALVRSKLEYCSVVWSPYQQVHINILENVLRKFCKFLYFKMFGSYPVRHCEQNVLLSIVNEKSLASRRCVAGLIFLQKILQGTLNSQALLSDIRLIVPRHNIRTHSTFKYEIPNTFNHFNRPMITCFRLYNCICVREFDIFHHNFGSRGIRENLLLLYS